jgi:transglutaminase-like putative cysteine protease
VTFVREKRLLLGALALAAPIPLPFNQVLEWPVLFLYGFAVVYFLQRADRDPGVAPGWLPDWALNLLGVVYTPLLVFDLRMSFLRNTPVTALLHLIMFLVVVKLYSIRRERDKWTLMMAIFFLFLGAMATSSHLTIVFYLVGFLAISLFALAAFAHLHVLQGVERGRRAGAAAPADPGGPAPGRPDPARRAPAATFSIRGPLLAGTVLVLAVAVPIFATLPRIREPFILGRGGTAGGGRTTGFSDSVDLSLTSAIRANRAVAMRIQYSDPVADAGELRFKGAAFDRYEDRNWYRLLRHGEMLSRGRDRAFRLARGEPAGRATVYLEPLDSVSLLLPVEALSVRVDPYRSLGLDPGGAAVLPGLPRRETVRYEVELAAEPRILAKLDRSPDSPLSALDPTGLTPRMRQLAVELMGEGSEEERVDRLERALLTGYAYTVDFVGRDSENPLEDFLFVYKSGHCEYFASVMVLMLRSQGIPARFVTGLLGAEFNPLEDYYIVRQQNAHAWVEAYTPARGWRLYDPTPPDGRPVIAQPGLKLLLTQLYDFINFRWDRYVLTYGADDQRSFFQTLRQRLARLWSRLRERGSERPEGSEGVVVPELPAAGGEAPAFWQPRLSRIAGAFLALGAALALYLWKRRPPLSAVAAYRALRRRLAHSDLEIGDELAPLELERLAAARYPAAAADLRRLVELYLRESFAGEELSAPQRESLKGAMRSIFETMKAADRARRRRPAASAVPVSA